MADTITLINGQTLDLYPSTSVVETCTDIELFAANAWLLLANAEMIFSDSRLFMSPIDMKSGVAYGGPFPPATLGAYVEWWHRRESRDSEGEPVLRLAGSPLSGMNKCTSVSPEGTPRTTTLRGYFNVAFRSLRQVCARYEKWMGACEAYPLTKVVDILREKGKTQDNITLIRDNECLRRRVELLSSEVERLRQYSQEKTDEYLRAILAPKVEECRKLHSVFADLEEHFHARLCELRKPRQEAKERLKRGEISQEKYRAIRDEVNEVIRIEYQRLEQWWMEHFIKLYHENARFFDCHTIGKYLTESQNDKQ